MGEDGKRGPRGDAGSIGPPGPAGETVSQFGTSISLGFYKKNVNTVHKNVCILYLGTTRKQGFPRF